MAKVLIPNHKYQLANFEDGGDEQTLTFIRKELVEGAGSELKTVENGTTNEEVLSVLIDRLQGLDEKFPDPDNKDAINHLRLALGSLNSRTAKRRRLGKEGKAIA